MSPREHPNPAGEPGREPALRREVEQHSEFPTGIARVALLQGPRGAGVGELLRRHCSESLDLREFAERSRLGAFLEELARPGPALGVGGAHLSPELLAWLSQELPRARRPLLLGSAVGLERRLPAEVVTWRIRPLTERELARATDTTPFLLRFVVEPGARCLEREGAALLAAVKADGSTDDARVWRGGLGGAQEPVDAGRLRRDFLELDLPAVARLRTPRVVWQLLEECVRDACSDGGARVGGSRSRGGGGASASELARHCGVSPSGARRHLRLLEECGLLRPLTAYAREAVPRQALARQRVPADSGLACALLGLADPGAVARHPARGALHVIHLQQNLEAMLAVHRPQARVCSWRVRDRRGVDFVVEAGTGPVGVRWGATPEPDREALRDLQAFGERAGGVHAAIYVHPGPGELVVRGERTYTLPEAMLTS